MTRTDRANAHKLQMTRSLYQVPYFELRTCAPKHALPQHVFRSARKPKCLEKQKINVAGQGQPQHRSYVGSVYRMRSLAVSYSLPGASIPIVTLSRPCPVSFYF